MHKMMELSVSVDPVIHGLIYLYYYNTLSLRFALAVLYCTLLDIACSVLQHDDLWPDLIALSP